MSILESTVNNIDSLDKTSIEQAKKRLDRLIKPQGSLGKMEDICMQLAGAAGPVPQKRPWRP